MPLQALCLPQPDTRLVVHGTDICKFKLQYRDTSESGLGATLPCDPATMSKEMEAVIRVLLHAKQHIKPFKIQTQHFQVDCSSKEWPTARDIMFHRQGVELNAHPRVFMLNVQPRISREQPVEGETLHSVEITRETRQKGNSKVAHLEPDSTKADDSPKSHQSRLSEAVNSQRCERDEVVTFQKHGMSLRRRALRQSKYSPRPPHSARLAAKMALNGKSTQGTRESSSGSSRNYVQKSGKKKKLSDGDHEPPDSFITRPVKQRKLDFPEVRRETRHSKHRANEESEGRDTSSPPKMPAKQIRVNHKPISKGEQKVAKQVLAYERDRQFIEQEDLAEEMKLQQLAKSSSPPQTRRRSLYEAAIDALVTPVKKLFR